jgi:hypothetical protein
MEGEGLKRRIAEAEAGTRKLGAIELGNMKVELSKRRDLFRLLTGHGYEIPLCVDSVEKEALARLFFSLNGTSCSLT